MRSLFKFWKYFRILMITFRIQTPCYVYGNCVYSDHNLIFYKSGYYFDIKCQIVMNNVAHSSNVTLFYSIMDWIIKSSHRLLNAIRKSGAKWQWVRGYLLSRKKKHASPIQTIFWSFLGTFWRNSEIERRNIYLPGAVLSCPLHTLP